MAKQRVNITLEPDTVERLRQYACENHLDSISAAITKLTWSAQLQEDQTLDVLKCFPEWEKEEG